MVHCAVCAQATLMANLGAKSTYEHFTYVKRKLAYQSKFKAEMDRVGVEAILCPGSVGGCRQRHF
jgi:hypothetical protein